MRSSSIGRQFRVKCNEQRDNVRYGRRIEPSKTPDCAGGASIPGNLLLSECAF